MNTKSIAALFSLALALLVSSPAQTVDSLPLSGLFEPYGVAVDYSDGSVYITDGSNNQVLRFDPSNNTTALIATLDASPEGIAVYNDATLGHGLAVAVPVDFTVRFIKLSDFSVSVLAGTHNTPGSSDSPALFRSPSGLVAASDGTLYVADLSGNSIRVIANTAAHTVSTLVVTNSDGSAVHFNRPSSIALASGNTIFVADNRNNSVKKIQNNLLVADMPVSGPRGLLWLGGVNGLLIATDDNVIRRAFGGSGGALIYSGSVNVAGAADGAIAGALFNKPTSLALDSQGQVLIADLGNDKLRRIVRSQALTPIVNPASALYTNDVTVLASTPTPNTTPGSVYRYTTDGNDPTYLSPILSGGLAVSGGPTAVKVRAFNPDFAASTIVSNGYSFAVSPLSFDVAGGLVNRSNDVAVAVLTATLGKTIRFTVDGSTPTVASPVWTDRTIASNVTLQLIGFKSGYADSALLSNKFAFFVNKPTIRFSTNSSNNDITVNVETLTDNARLFYTTDLSEPSSSNGIEIPNRTDFVLKKTGEFRVVGERAGYTPSERSTAIFTLKVAPPQIVAAATNSTAPIHIDFTSDTVGAKFRYTVNGALPTPTTGTVAPVGGFDLAQNGLLRIIAYRDGVDDKYEPSVVVEQAFGLSVAKPVIQPFSTNSPVDLNITASSTTPSTTIRYWVTKLDGSNTTTNEVPSGTAFPINAAGTLNVVGIRSGFVSSEVVTAPVVLQVSNPAIAVTPTSSPAINRVTVGLTSASVNGKIRYTLDGTSPITNLNAVVYTAPFVVDTNATLVVVATNIDYIPSDVLTRSIVVQADTPVMTPPGGFFQDGTTLSFAVARSGGAFATDSSIYYTLDGTDPSTNSTKYAGPFKINAINFPSSSLRLVKAKAIAAGVLDSAVISGELSATNKIGVSRAVTSSGSGATIFVPVVVSLASGVEIRSLQYRVQVWPKTVGAPNLGANALTLTPVLANSFIKIVGSLDGNTTNFVASSQTTGAVKTNELAISFLANSSNLRMREFGTVNLLKIKLPGTAAVDAEYGVRILEASGTTDAQQTRVVFGTGPESDRTIKIKNIPYVVGDTSPGTWYNAGDFGDGDLDNSDVNNAFYASFNLHLPEADSDVFRAMDVFPLDFDGIDGAGDGQIRFLDWNIILNRALRLRDDNFTRYWTNGFDSPLSLSLTGLTRNASPDGVGTTLKPKGAVERWFRPANLQAQIRQTVTPGAPVSVPVILEVKQGFTVRGLQFAATVESSDGTIAKPTVGFTRAGGVPVGLGASELEQGQTGYAWPVGGVTFSAGSYTLGSLNFVVPANAPAGTTFTIRFVNADGAENIETQMDFETLHGAVMVNGTLPPNIFGRQSDEWMTRFFGRIDNANAAANLDPDGDGVTNADEFSAGSNPTELRVHSLAEWTNHSANGFKVRFFAAPGKTYGIDSGTSATGPWTEIQGSVAGDGNMHEFTDATSPDATKFYRVRGNSGL